MIWNLFKSKKTDTVLEKPIVEPVVAKKEKKPRKPRVKKSAEPKQEPKVEILKFDFDPNNPMLGSIELDWNQAFIDLLTTHGYAGASAEEKVDKWLNDVCRNIIADQFPGATVAGSALVNRKNLGAGKIEIS